MNLPWRLATPEVTFKVVSLAIIPMSFLKAPLSRLSNVYLGSRSLVSRLIGFLADLKFNFRLLMRYTWLYVASFQSFELYFGLTSPKMTSYVLMYLILKIIECTVINLKVEHRKFNTRKPIKAVKRY